MNARDMFIAMKSMKVEEGKSFAVAECVDGNVELAVMGDSLCLIQTVNAIMDRLAKITDTDIQDVASLVGLMRRIGYKGVVAQLGEEATGKRFMQGSDYLAEKETGIAQAYEEKYEAKCKALQSTANTLLSQVERLKSEIESKNMIISGLKEAAEVKRKAVDKQIKALQKEIKAEQHRNYDYLAIQGFTPDKLRALAEEIEKGGGK